MICLHQDVHCHFRILTEAEYTYSQRKDIIPLLLQQGYVPDGWLGALVGTHIYFDMTEEQTLNCQVSSPSCIYLLQLWQCLIRKFFEMLSHSSSDVQFVY